MLRKEVVKEVHTNGRVWIVHTNVHTNGGVMEDFGFGDDAEMVSNYFTTLYELFKLPFTAFSTPLTQRKSKSSLFIVDKLDMLGKAIQ